MLFVALTHGQEDEISEHLRGSQFKTISEAMQALLKQVSWAMNELERTGQREEAIDMQAFVRDISTFLRPL
jgi:hypothetical protein